MTFGKIKSYTFSTPSSRLACLNGSDVMITEHAPAIRYGTPDIVTFLHPDTKVGTTENCA